MTYNQAQIVSNNEIAPDIYCMIVNMPEIAKTTQAGQFVMVYLKNGELLLPRPISICNVDENRSTISLVYQVVGKGTKIMSNMRMNKTIKLLGPLGKGFYTGKHARTPMKKVALVGGGIGTPPLLLLAKTLNAQGAVVDAYLGFRNQPILVDEFTKTVDNLQIATDSGSVGHHGNILEVLQSSGEKYDEILSCGPRPMLNALANYANSTNTPCQLSMEERMACGLGTCVGCVLKVHGTYTRICTEGPVFYSDEVSRHE